VLLIRSIDIEPALGAPMVHRVGSLREESEKGTRDDIAFAASHPWLPPQL